MTDQQVDKVAEAMATVDREMGQLPRRFGNGRLGDQPRVEKAATETGTLPQWLEHFGKSLASMDARLAKIEKFLGV